MDEELKARWVAALRSGRYQQGTGYLCIHGRFCCLGVLADVVDPSKWGPRHPDGWVLWGDRRASLGIVGWVTESRLSRMNDVDGKSFAAIADYIEASL